MSTTGTNIGSSIDGQTIDSSLRRSFEEDYEREYVDVDTHSLGGDNSGSSCGSGCTY